MPVAGCQPGYSLGVPAVANCLPKSDHCTMEAGGTPGPEVRQETALPRARLCPVPRSSTTAVSLERPRAKEAGGSLWCFTFPGVGVGLAEGSCGPRGLIG